MTRPNATEILMTGPLMAYAADQLKAQYAVHELWKAEDKAAFLREISGRVRGIAAGGGHNRVDGALFDALPNLEIISSFGVGYDHVDAAEAGRRGLIVTNTPDVLTDEVADLAIGLLISTVRQLPQVDRYLREGKWLKAAYPLTTSLRKRSVGIVGLGRIGKAVAHRIEAFGLPIAYHGRSRQADVPYRYYPSLVEMAADVDTLISVAPGGASTHHIINAEVLKALGPNGIVVNVGRGTVIDEKALVEALQNKTILSAGLDVFEDEPRVPAELIAIEHAVLLPHVGSASVHTREQMGQLLVDNLLSWFDDKGPLTPVAETPWKKA
ncbi:2-hydroxyacid dehydrogenase [Bosea sp. 124]|uniref:2-hydroxyacid dehydrogenase n=1 Tax=Bosea sp. 124 TaxID=2135642 RepID=UPI000D3D4067|nr:2-hydroxyacid dehydrogenase [Bosea sp. 124]PTM40863.1 lactate dehydrogenase-like 2-hydroxyacid dehydrogenase [Bosea sp. 124]